MLNSKHIFDAHYDEVAETLRIQFTSGSIYLYKSVPQATYDALMKADSASGFFRDQIKDVFQFEKIT